MRKDGPAPVYGHPPASSHGPSLCSAGLGCTPHRRVGVDGGVTSARPVAIGGVFPKRYSTDDTLYLRSACASLSTIRRLLSVES